MYKLSHFLVAIFNISFISHILGKEMVRIILALDDFRREMYDGDRVLTTFIVK